MLAGKPDATEFTLDEVALEYFRGELENYLSDYWYIKLRRTYLFAEAYNQHEFLSEEDLRSRFEFAWWWNAEHDADLDYAEAWQLAQSYDSYGYQWLTMQGPRDDEDYGDFTQKDHMKWMDLMPPLIGENVPDDTVINRADLEEDFLQACYDTWNDSGT